MMSDRPPSLAALAAFLVVATPWALLADGPDPAKSRAADDALAAGRDHEADDRDVRASRRDVNARSQDGDLDVGFPNRYNSAVDRNDAAGDRAAAHDDRAAASDARGRAAAHRSHAALDRQQAVAHLRLGLDGHLSAPVVALNGAMLPFPGVAQRLFPAVARLLFVNPVMPAIMSFQASRPGAVARVIASTASGSRRNSSARAAV